MTDAEAMAEGVKNISNAESCTTTELCIGTNCDVPTTSDRVALALAGGREITAKFQAEFFVEEDELISSVVADVVASVKADIASASSIFRQTTPSSNAFAGLSEDDLSGVSLTPDVETTDVPTTDVPTTDVPTTGVPTTGVPPVAVDTPAAGSSSDAGMIAGVVVGVVVFVAIVAAVVYFKFVKGTTTAVKAVKDAEIPQHVNPGRPE